MALVTHHVQPVALHEATRHRYLNYALSVITSRALPDVRDGLKPVQRRILYAMYNNLRLLPDGRYRKSAAVVGEVMAKFHPHGDSSIYDALVRMAQPFSLRHPLVDGQGNFGSLDGDNAAAMRYTECKLRPLAVELLSEIKQRTVEFRPNYDGQHLEPEVLPAQFPQLLVNGSEGIAVGMATRIPPHNLREVIDACVLMIYNPEATAAMLARKVKGPDFPTGGLILNSREELREIYQNGQGAVRTRGVWSTEKVGRKNYVIITEIPYSVNKASLVEKIGGLIAARKLPQLNDVRDESTDEVRIVLELRKSGDEHAAMAFLCKHTPLQTNFHVNLTCLIPTDRLSFPEPKRCNLQEVIRAWLDFRYATVRRRFEFQLEKLKERIHILQGFAIIFDALDEAIRIIRASQGKRDAAEQIMVRFDLDDVQTDAILELRLYKIAQLEILAIRDELEEKLAEAARIEAILGSAEELWSNVREELLELRKLYGEKRRTEIGGVEEVQVLSYSEDDYIVAEDAYVIVTRDGWIKRQGRFTEIEKIRIRDGDQIGWIARASTRSTLSILTDHGVAYSLRIDDVPSTTGYGEPIQRQFNFSDGERVVGVIAHDPKALPEIPEEVLAAADEENPSPPHGLALTRKGRTLRFPLSGHSSPSNKNGRRYMRPDGSDDGVLAVYVSDGTETLSIASVQGRAICFEAREVKIIRGSGKGVMGIKLRPGDRVMAFELTREKFKGALITTSTGREEIVRPSKFAGKRGGRGRVVLKRGSFVSWDLPVIRYDLSTAAQEPEAVEGEQQALDLLEPEDAS